MNQFQAGKKSRLDGKILLSVSVVLKSVRVRVVWVRIRSSVVFFTTRFYGFFLQGNISRIFWVFGLVFLVFSSRGFLGNLNFINLNFLRDSMILFFAFSGLFHRAPPTIFGKFERGRLVILRYLDRCIFNIIGVLCIFWRAIFKWVRTNVCVP